MIEKEIGELRRRLRPDRTNITSVYGCYVSDSREILSSFRQSLSICTEDDKELYLGLLKKALSGSIDKNLLDLTFRTQQVADSDEHRLLMKLRETKLTDEETLRQFYQTVIDSLSIEGHYLILLAHESYDVPFKARDGAALEDGDTVFSYILCAVCPVKPSKPALSYCAEEKSFKLQSPGWTASAPELGFLFPAFDGALLYEERCGQSRGADRGPVPCTAADAGGGAARIVPVGAGRAGQGMRPEGRGIRPQ